MRLVGTSGRVWGVTTDGAHVAGDVVAWEIATGRDSVTEKPRSSAWDGVAQIRWTAGAWERICELPHTRVQLKLHRPDGTEVRGEATIETCKPVQDADYGKLVRTDLHGAGPVVIRKAARARGSLKPVEFED